MIGSNRFCHFGGWSGRQAPSRWSARTVREADHEAWEELFVGYCDFYEHPSTVEQRRQVWSWITAGTIHCLLAVPQGTSDGRAVGLAHVRECPSPLRGSMNGYLDDLFVKPAARGTGAFEALLGAVRELAVAEGWGNVRWITAGDNMRAQAAYDRISTRTEWLTYQLDVGAPRICRTSATPGGET
jgi:GNAT superfamily N-acetyltransferase